MKSSSTGQGSLIGATLGGYEVVALIGRGAMGTVYLARDVKLNRLVALKVLLGSLAKSKSVVAQFHKEAQAVAPLNHPGIVRVYSAGTEHGIPYIVMEYVDGEPLDRFLHRKGTVKWDVALHVCIKLAKALESAHKTGIVHRDIKPSNIMLDKKGGVRLMDFGIASIHTDGGGAGGHNFLGTPQYMSPEQSRNKDVGPSSDLYSLGVTIYQMISGKMPFTGETSVALINSICNDEAPRLNIANADVPDDVARFVAYLMGKTPRQRPANAKVVHTMVRRLLQEKGELNSMSNTISDFIETEMDVSAFSSVHQKKKKKKKYTPGKSRAELLEAKAHRREVYANILRVIVIVFAGLAAYGIGRISHPSIELDAAHEVPGVDALNIHKVDAGLSIIELNRRNYTFSDIHWIGTSGNLWLELLGEPGTMGHGTVGGVAVDLLEGRGYAVLPLQSPLLSPDVDDVYLSSMERVAFTHIPEDYVQEASFLISASDPIREEVVVLSREWNKAYPDSTALLRVPREKWVWQQQDDVLEFEYGNALKHPNGTSILYVLYDNEKNYSYLYEQLLDPLEPTFRNKGIRRTSSSTHVIPDSVQYVPQTNEVVYWRKRGGVGSELWRLPSEAEEMNGERILSGVQGDDYALSPDGTMVAVQFDDGEGRGPQVVIAQLRSGLVTAQLGPGKVSRHAWHPTKPYLVIQQPVYSNGALKPQLVAVNLDKPKQRIVITQRDGGVGAAYAISPDGRKLAVVDGESKQPSVLVLNWNQLDLLP